MNSCRLLTGKSLRATNTSDKSAINTTGATLIVIAVAQYTITDTPNITDSASNTWTKLTAYGNNSGLLLAYTTTPVTSATHTFTDTPTGNIFGNPGMRVWIQDNGQSEHSDADSADTARQTARVLHSLVALFARSFRLVCWPFGHAVD